MKFLKMMLILIFFLVACRLSEIPAALLGDLLQQSTASPEVQYIIVTETPAPSPTSTPKPVEKALLFSDDFSEDKGHWTLSEDSTSKYFLIDGKYEMDAVKSDYYYYTISDQSFPQGVFNVEVQHVDGDDAITSSMVFWRYKDDSNHYAMTVSDDGTYLIYRYLKGNYEMITLPSHSEALSVDGEINKITIAFTDDINDIYFNDQFIFRFIDPSIKTGGIGMGVFPDVSSDVKVFFDNLTVYNYDHANAYTPPEPALTPTPEYTSITWQDLVNFLADDHTNWHAYDLEEYNCLDYAIDLVKNARAEGIKAQIVTVDFQNQGLGHAFVQFETSDKGLTYVEPQVDNTYTNVEIGNNLCDDWGEYECMGIISDIYYYQDCDHAQNCTVELP